MFLVFAFFTKEAIGFTVAYFSFVTDVSDGAFPYVFILGVWAATLETYYQFGITAASFNRVTETMATITLGEWWVGDEFLSGGALAEKRGRVTDHEF